MNSPPTPRTRPVRKRRGKVRQPWIPNLTARRRGTLAQPTERQQPPLTPQQKLLLLDTWQRSGLPAGDFGEMVHISRHTLYAWKRRFEQQGPAGLMEQPRGVTAGSRLPELTKRSILMLSSHMPSGAASESVTCSCAVRRCRPARRPWQAHAA